MSKARINRWSSWVLRSQARQEARSEELARLQAENRRLRQEMSVMGKHERILNAILENVPEGIGLVDAADISHPVLSKFIDEAIHKEWGIPAEIPLDLSPESWELFYPDGKTPLLTADFPTNRAIREGITIRDQEINVRLSSSIHLPMLCSASPVRDSEGRISGAVATYKDIREHKQAEFEREQLLSKFRAERDRLLTLINNIKDEIWFCDAEGNIDLVNHAAVQNLGFENLEDLFHVVSRVANDLEIYRPDGIPRPPEESPLLLTLQGDPVRGEEIVHNKKTGEKIYREYNTSPIRSDTGTILGAVAVTRDISQYKRAMQALRDSEQRFQRVADAIEEGVWDIDLEHHATWWNEAYDRLFGPRPSGTRYSADWWSERIHEEDRPRVQQNSDAALQGSSDRWSAEYRFRRADGTYAYVVDRACIARDENGRAVRLTGAMLDLTELKQAMLALQESQERLLLTREAVQQGTWDWDLAQDALVWDERCKALFGLPPQAEISYVVFLEVVHPEDRLRVDEAIQNALEKHATYDIEMRVIWPDESLHWILSKGQVLFDAADVPIRMIGIALDITARKQYEENNHAYQAQIEVQRRLIEQREQERMQIARDLHDGPLQELIVLSYACQEIVNSLNDPQAREALNKIRARLQEQIRELRAYASELRPPTLADFGLEKAIRSHLNDFQLKHPEIQVEFQAAYPSVNQLAEAPRMALYRIYQELLNNVVKHAQADHVLIRLSKINQDIRLEVQDNGKGFTPPREWVELARQKHLGLVGIQERAQAVDGAVEIRSAPGQGTLVQVTVPM
jgi:PAS domain S-box-containing protein